MAVRLSIGAGRKHIVGQLLVESMLLGSLGGAAGLLVARWTLVGMAAILPAGDVEISSLQLDTDMLRVCGGIVFGTGCCSGCFPRSTARVRTS